MCFEGLTVQHGTIFYPLPKKKPVRKWALSIDLISGRASCCISNFQLSPRSQDILDFCSCLYAICFRASVMLDSSMSLYLLELCTGSFCLLRKRQLTAASPRQQRKIRCKRDGTGSANTRLHVSRAIRKSVWKTVN